VEQTSTPKKRMIKSSSSSKYLDEARN